MEKIFSIQESTDDNLSMLLQEPFLSGEMPFICHSDGKVNIDPLVTGIKHPDAPVIKASITGYSHKIFQGTDDWKAVISFLPHNHSAYVQVVGKSQTIIDSVIETVLGKVPTVEFNEINKYRLNFTFSAGSGMMSVNPRSIDLINWDNIRPNYSESIVSGIETMMDLSPDKISGKLLILHGPTGTGKTTLLSCLAGTWRDWCSASYIIDPQALLNDPNYMYSCLLEEDYDDDGKNKWKLIIMEDSDDAQSDSKISRYGSGLSTLLNLTDGLLGQGRKLIIAITTNEKINNLDPAMVRPGRLLREIMVPELTPAEAVKWALTHGTSLPVKFSDVPLTLSELYAIKRGENPDPLNKKEHSTGMLM